MPPFLKLIQVGFPYLLQESYLILGTAMEASESHCRAISNGISK